MPVYQGSSVIFDGQAQYAHLHMCSINVLNCEQVCASDASEQHR